MTSQRDTQPTQRKMITKRRPTAITCDSVGKKDDKASLPLLVGSKKVNCSIFRFVRRPIEVGMVPSSLFCRLKSNFVSRVRFLRVDVPNNRLSRMLSRPSGTCKIQVRAGWDRSTGWNTAPAIAVSHSRPLRVYGNDPENLVSPIKMLCQSTVLLTRAPSGGGTPRAAYSQYEDCPETSTCCLRTTHTTTSP